MADKTSWDTPEQEKAFSKWYDKACRQFMVPVVECGAWYEVDGPCGVWYVDAEVSGLVSDRELELANDSRQTPDQLMDYTENGSQCFRVEFHPRAYGCRFSAPGYMDCTDCCVFVTEREAWEYLMEQDDGMEDADEEEEAANDHV